MGWVVLRRTYVDISAILDKEFWQRVIATQTARGRSQTKDNAVPDAIKAKYV